MAAIELKSNVYWVGAIHWNTCTAAPRGTTFNAYLVVDEQITLVDTVYAPYTADLINHISEIVAPTEIDNIIVNHIEPEHIGAFPEIMRLNPSAKVYAAANAVKGITNVFYKDLNINAVKTGDSINTGKYTFRFIETPMLHWPDSMFTYISKLKLLLPNDVFSQHYASNQRFADQVDEESVMESAKKYYADILNPVSQIVLRKLAEVEKLELEIDMIAPSHGFIWRKEIEKLIAAYQRWAQMNTGKKVVVG